MASYNYDLITAIKLKRTLSLVQPDPGYTAMEYTAHLVSIEALDASDNPLDIFVYQTETLNQNAASFNPDSAFFTAVCSPNDYQELPAGIPSNSDILLFRYNRIDAIARSMTEVEFIWEEVKKDVSALVEQHKRMNNLGGDVSIEIIN